MRYFLKILFLLIFQLSYGQSEIDFTPKKSLRVIEQEHNILANLSYPNPNDFLVDSLLDDNFDLFDSLLDLALLIKYDSLYDPRMYELISVLEKGESEINQQEIVVELSSYGKEVLVQLDKSQCTSKSFIYWRNIIRILVLGYETEDFIDQWNTDDFGSLISISKFPQRHYFNLQGRYTREREYLRRKLVEYISSKSYSNHARYYHDLAMNAYKKGTIHPGFKYYIIKEIINQEVESKNESFLYDYLPIIHEINQNEALDIIDFIAEAKKNNYYPQVFLELLRSKNENFVGRVIDWSSRCCSGSICEDVKTELYEIFESGSYKLKLEVAFVLMHDYDDLAAYNHLISIVESKKSLIDDSKYTAISGLGDTCNSGKSMSSRLNKALMPYLKSEDNRIKRATIETYLTYESSYVIEAIIPYVDFEIEYIAKEIRERILLYEDKEFVIENLKSYLAKNKESKSHQEILSKLEK